MVDLGNVAWGRYWCKSINYLMISSVIENNLRATENDPRAGMGDYCAPARGIMEIMRPEGHIMPPEGGIMQPKGGIMFPEGLHNFHWPEGRAQ